MCITLFAIILVLGCIGGQESEFPTTQPLTPSTMQAPTTTLRPDLQNYKDAVGSRDSSACAGIEDERVRDICLRDIAIKEKNSGLCDSIVTSSIRDICYYRVAIELKDKSVCEGVGSQSLRQRCIDTV
jgi:hypothetical protein